MFKSVIHNRFFLKLLGVGLLVVLVWAYGYNMLNTGLKKFNFLKEERLHDIFEDNEYNDVVFAGSSRCYYTINPVLVDSLLNIKSYNLGVEGGIIVESSMMIEAYLKAHPKPKLIVLSLDAHSFSPKSSPFFDYTIYQNFLTNWVVDSTLASYGHRTWLFKTVPSFKLLIFDDHTREKAIQGLLGRTQFKSKNAVMRGFQPKQNTFIPNNIKSANLTKVQFDSNRVNMLNRITNICRQQNIDLILLYTPEYKGVRQDIANFSEFIDLVQGIARENNIPFWRHDLLAMNNDNTLFYDIRHVNGRGANVYSEILAQLLKPYIKKK